MKLNVATILLVFSSATLAAPPITPENRALIEKKWPVNYASPSEIEGSIFPDYAGFNRGVNPNNLAKLPLLIRYDFSAMEFVPIEKSLFGSQYKIGAEYNNEIKKKIISEQLGKINKSDLISVKYGSGEKKIFVVSAPECPACKHLEGMLFRNADRINATVYYIPIHLDGRRDSELTNFWCAQGDKGQAWLDYWRKGISPVSQKEKCLYSPIDGYVFNIFVGGKHATPKLVFEDGSTRAGAPTNQDEFIQTFGGGSN